MKFSCQYSMSNFDLDGIKIDEQALAPIMQSYRLFIAPVLFLVVLFCICMMCRPKAKSNFKTVRSRLQDDDFTG